MDIHIDILPAYHSLLGVSYEKMDMLVDHQIKTGHHISFGVLLAKITFVIYEKNGS